MFQLQVSLEAFTGGHGTSLFDPQSSAKAFRNVAVPFLRLCSRLVLLALPLHRAGTGRLLPLMASFKEPHRHLLLALLALLLSPPPSWALESLSQFGQDAFIINAVYGNSLAGSAGSAGSARYFIELGAVDGFEFSNTLSLERDLGWRGLCIEPSAMYHELVASNRTYVKSKRDKRSCCVCVCVCESKCVRASVCSVLLVGCEHLER